MRAFATPPSSGAARAPPAAAYAVPAADAHGSALRADRIPGVACSGCQPVQLDDNDRAYDAALH